MVLNFDRSSHGKGDLDDWGDDQRNTKNIDTKQCPYLTI